MEAVYLSKEQIALELTLAIIEKCVPHNDDWSPDGEGKMIANLYNSVYENLKVE